MRPLVVTLLCMLAAACGPRGHEAAPAGTPPAGAAAPAGASAGAAAAFEQNLEQQLLNARPGSVIEIPVGTHPLERALAVRANGVTLRGAGAERSILSFSKAPAGTAGIVVSGNAFTIENLGISDSKGDALAVNGGENIAVRAVHAAFSGGPQGGNGAFGIHVQGARNVLIEDCAVYSASGAGVYVAQSLNVIVRRCDVEQDTVGIALANTVGADLQDGVATGNSAGIVVFNSADVTPAGRAVRIFRNRLFKNNLGNFAAAGSALAGVPAGCGVLVNASSEVEIFDNDISDNQTANVMIATYFMARAPALAGGAAAAPAYPQSIQIYGNRFVGGGYAPSVAELKGVLQGKLAPAARLPDVVWDGYRAERQAGQPAASPRICVTNGSAAVLDADAPHGFSHPASGVKPFRCTLRKLAAVSLPAAP